MAPAGIRFGSLNNDDRSLFDQAEQGFKFRKLAQKLEKEFPHKLEITSEATPNVTGFFEVSVGDKLIHSKKNGDGYVDNSGKEKKIMDAIRAVV